MCLLTADFIGLPLPLISLCAGVLNIGEQADYKAPPIILLVQEEKSTSGDLVFVDGIILQIC